MSPLIGVKSSFIGIKNVKRVDFGTVAKFSSLPMLAKGQVLPHPRMVFMVKPARGNPSFDSYLNNLHSMTIINHVF